MTIGKINLIPLGFFLALGMTVGGYFIGQTMYNAKVAVNTSTVKGLAERVVESDMADWSMSFSVAGKQKSDVPALYKRAEADQATIIALIKSHGFSDDEIQVGIINYHHKIYRNNLQMVVDQSHWLSGSIKVVTNKVNAVKPLRAAVNKLIAKGMDIDNGRPNYRFTKLNDIKPEMLQEATKNARIAANEFAKNAGVAVGSIRNAHQGNFNIRDFGENYGDSLKIKKTVRVITTITFYLTD